MDATAARVRPPAGIAASPGIYGLLDARLRREAPDLGAAELELEGGAGSARVATRWLGGTAALETQHDWRTLGMDARASVFGLDYFEPFRYQAYGWTLAPRFSADAGAWELSLSGDLRRGHWRLPAQPDAGLDADSGPLAVTGGSAAAARRLGPVEMEIAADALRGALDGVYYGGTAAVAAAAGPTELGLWARAWDTPAGRQLGWDATIRVPLRDGMVARAEIGRTTTDPLYGTPGSFSASVGVSVRVGGRAEPSPRIAERPVVEVGSGNARAHRVRFRLDAPNSRTAAVSGDFTRWRPRAMHREGGAWVLELMVPPGFHRFGFVVDGTQWTVPSGAPGIVEDGWGRRNASFVVEP